MKPTLKSLLDMTENFLKKAVNQKKELQDRLKYKNAYQANTFLSYMNEKKLVITELHKTHKVIRKLNKVNKLINGIEKLINDTKNNIEKNI